MSIFEVVEAFLLLLLLLLISGFSSGSSRYVRCDFAQEEGRKLCMLEYYACRGRRREKGGGFFGGLTDLWRMASAAANLELRIL